MVKSRILFLFFRVSIAFDSWTLNLLYTGVWKWYYHLCEGIWILMFMLELAFEASNANSIIFDNVMPQLESLSTQLILAEVFWVMLCASMVESCVALFDTSFLNYWTSNLLEDSKKFKLGVWMCHILYSFRAIFKEK